MSRIRAITSGDSRARLRLAKPLRCQPSRSRERRERLAKAGAPTPRGAHGLDEDLGAPRLGTYVMARALRRREASVRSSITLGQEGR